MNSKYQWILLASIVVTLIFVVSQFMGQSSNPKMADPLATLDIDDLPLEDFDDLDTQVGLASEETLIEPEPAAKTSYWTKSKKKVSDAQVAKSNGPLVLGAQWGNEYQAKAAIESALSGNVEDAVEIGDIFSRCLLGFNSEAQFKRILARTSRGVANGGPVPSIYLSGTGERLKFEQYENYEEYMWIRFAECTLAKSLFDRSLRDRLVKLAEQGNVAARFLYAMRLPDRGGIRTDVLLDWLIYQKLAEEFTWQNINEGEPLGLLAYGRSLEGGQTYYFTPRNTIYGQAFIWAAQKCGLNSSMVNEKVNNMTTGASRTLAQVGGPMDKMANEIVETFCD